jgi:hypothetical protein
MDSAARAVNGAIRLTLGLLKYRFSEAEARVPALIRWAFADRSLERPLTSMLDIIASPAR